jgi:uncharacterized protein (TIGR03663 family)
MKWPMKFWLTALAILVIAAGLRLWHLSVRPMHGDEAVHAYKFGQLLEKNYYRYDPQEFHGPALNYFTLISAWLSGKHTYASLNDTTLRIVPVLFGLLVVIMPLLLADDLGKSVALIAAAFTAISPAFVFYSRYYIPEMLLVYFTFGVIVCGYRYTRNKKWIWALLTGIFAGLCFATKETSVIAFGAVVVALAIVSLIQRENQPFLNIVHRGHLILAIAGAIAVWGLFYSSFFTNPTGLLDSFRSFSTYLGRAGNNQFHIHPWYYYLKLLTYNKAAMGPAWTEGFIVILAVVGLIVVIIKRGVWGLDSNLLNFIAIYTVIMTVIYSAIPYKTPWCLLSFYQGMILLAAIGVVATIQLLGRMLARVVVAIFFLTAATDLALQSVSAGIVRNVDYSNPYVYAHPTADVLRVEKRIEQVSDAYPAKKAMPVLVVCHGGDYWPLPWYLRSFKNVGWYNDVNEVNTSAPVVIAAAQLQGELITKMYDLSPPGKKNLYVPLFDKYLELRPQVELRGYITKDLLDESRQQNSER